MQFSNCFQENLLHTVFCLLFIFQILHTHTQQQQGVALQQNTQPFIITVCIESLKQFLVGDMVVQFMIHGLKVAIFICYDAVVSEFHIKMLHHLVP